MISIQLYKIRLKNGWSQETLTEKLNTSRQTISKWESGLSKPTLDNLILMKNVLDVSYEELIGE